MFRSTNEPLAVYANSLLAVYVHVSLDHQPPPHCCGATYRVNSRRSIIDKGLEGFETGSFGLKMVNPPRTRHACAVDLPESPQHFQVRQVQPPSPVCPTQTLVDSCRPERHRCEGYDGNICGHSCRCNHTGDRTDRSASSSIMLTGCTIPSIPCPDKDHLTISTVLNATMYVWKVSTRPRSFSNHPASDDYSARSIPPLRAARRRRLGQQRAATTGALIAICPISGRSKTVWKYLSYRPRGKIQWPSFSESLQLDRCTTAAMFTPVSGFKILRCDQSLCVST